MHVINSNDKFQNDFFLFLRYFHHTSHPTIAQQQIEMETTQHSIQKFIDNQPNESETIQNLNDNQQHQTTIQQKLETVQLHQLKTTTNQQKHNVDLIWNDLSSN